MKNKLWLSALMGLAIVTPILLLAQAVAPTVPSVVTDPSVSNEDFFKMLLLSMNGLKGASAMAIAAMVTQILVALMKTPIFNSFFGNMMGKYKLLVVSGFSLAAGILALKVAGLDWMATITHSFTLTAMQVFGHQIISQVSEKKDDAPAAPAAPAA